MRVNEDYQTWNAAAQVADPTSVHAFWKKALAVRKQFEVLVRHADPSRSRKSIYSCIVQIYGDFKDISAEYDTVFAFIRTLGTAKALILLNFKEGEVDFVLPERESLEGLKLILANYGSVEEALESKNIHLKGYEGRLYIVE